MENPFSSAILDHRERDSIADYLNNLPRSTTIKMLTALQRKPIYMGTVDPAVVETRREKNRVARKQRRVNRLKNHRKGVR